MKKFIALLIILSMILISVPAVADVTNDAADEGGNPYFEALLDSINLARTVVVGNFTLPTTFPNSDVTVNWVAEDSHLTNITPGSDDDYVNVTVTPLRTRDISTRISAVISDDDVTVSRDFSFSIIRNHENNLFANRTAIDDNAELTKRTALVNNSSRAWSVIDDEDVLVWEIIGDDRTISVDAGARFGGNRLRVFAEFIVVFDGVAVSGVRIYSSSDTHAWRPVTTTGTINPNVANYIPLDFPIYARYVRFVFPAGVESVWFIGAYDTAEYAPGQGRDVFYGINLPHELIAPIELPQYTPLGNFPITWTSPTPSVIRIDNNLTATPTRQNDNRTINVTGTIDADGDVISFLHPFLVPRLPQQSGGPTGPSGPSGSSGPSGLGFRPPNQIHIDNIQDITPQPPSPDPDWTPPVIFTDIDGHWAEDYIMELYDLGIMSGVSDGEFAPNVATTRAMFVTVLWRAAGEPEVDVVNSFIDVPLNVWYTTAVIWAMQNNIVTGVSDGYFAPHAEITREQMGLILYRYIGELVDSVMDRNYVPQNTATRAEMATVILRLLELEV